MKEAGFKIELCTDLVNMAIKHGGNCDQIEFCADLENDGLTPMLEDVRTLLQEISIPVKVMIRCRPGNFEYSQEEFVSMQVETKAFMDIGVKHFVFGAMLNHRLDIQKLATFCEFVSPFEVCLHKAIDQSANILEDVKLVKDIPNLTEILSSGGSATALDGAELLRKMIEAGGSEITIIPAGKITSTNLFEIHDVIGAKIYHGRKIV